jgi:mannitol operon transcriptional antiterminator
MNSLITNPRTKAILNFLANSDEIVTFKQIAEEIGVSRRTILREFPDAEFWLKSHNFELQKKQGQGIVLKGGEPCRSRLRDILSENMSCAANTPKDRQKILLVELLQQKEPVKLYAFTSKLGVSASTISNDLDKLEIWLNKYKLGLIRKTGLGVYIDGKEEDFRKAMISLLYENLGEEELIQILKDVVPNRRIKSNLLQVNVKNRLLSLIDRNSIEKIENIVYALERRLEYKFIESACIGLMVHLALAIQRIKNKENISIDHLLLEELKISNEFPIASELAGEVSSAFSIDIPIDEVGYITMHLKGARTYNSSLKEQNKVSKLNLAQIACEMIDVVETEYNIHFKENEKLLHDLICHLEPAVKRLEMNLDIRNPLLGQIKQLFPEVYRISEKASRILNNYLDKDIPESEIGFIAMHFGAAIEKSTPAEKTQFRVIIACPSGIGSSRLLAARLEREFKNITIVDTLSAFDISADLVNEKKVDMVISTLPVKNCPVKNLSVNPLLMEEDILVIRHELAHTRSQDDKVLPSSIHPDTLKNNIDYAMEYSSFISQILENCNIVIESQVRSSSQLLSKIAKVMHPDDSKQNLIVKQLNDRNIMYPSGDLLIFGCILSGIESCTLLICRADTGTIMQFSGKNCGTILVLSIPEKKSSLYENILNDLSVFISKSAKMKDLIKAQDEESIRKNLCELLSELYFVKLSEWRSKLHK